MSLVSEVAARDVGLADGIKFIGPLADTGSSLASGDWAGGLVGMVGTGLDALGAVMDPIGTLAASVAGFLMEHVDPLPEWLDNLAGSPEEVTAISNTWNNVGTHVDGLADQYESAANNMLVLWHGAAATAYGEAATGLTATLRADAEACRNLSGGFAIASGIVTAIRGLVRDLIADLVGKLISWAGEVAFTAGLGATWVVPKACEAIRKWVAKAREWIDKLTRAFTELDGLLSKLDGFLKKLDDLLKSVVTRAPIPPIRPERFVIPSSPVLDGVNHANTVGSNVHSGVQQGGDAQVNQ